MTFFSKTNAVRAINVVSINLDLSSGVEVREFTPLHNFKNLLSALEVLATEKKNCFTIATHFEDMTKKSKIKMFFNILLEKVEFSNQCLFRVFLFYFKVSYGKHWSRTRFECVYIISGCIL